MSEGQLQDATPDRHSKTSAEILWVLLCDGRLGMPESSRPMRTPAGLTASGSANSSRTAAMWLLAYSRDVGFTAGEPVNHDAIIVGRYGA